ncbi:ABC transporter [Desulfuribacillus stibiiarsenatis]|uniref:ABC transporter n=1 Tax=Desulfuribacillus stibiiarsenatis TaxID=1390249 RepID=A0A1E5LA02_9FIRM|nr:ABC-F type ribosomal protection protein [Desulfuribacillus stibiiarsenatis]OEH86972.1 ABC transporter [Desulfuribacillus stibiiarsenatis]
MILLEAHNLNHYIKDRLLLNINHLQIHKNDRIGLVGHNGSGKTTLLHVLANIIKPDYGNVTHYAYVELLPQLKETKTTKSGGEVTQAYINEAIIKAPELLLADEPTTHLDAEHIEWLEKKLIQWKGAFVVISHDRTFLDALCTKIWEINEGELTEYHGNYTDYMEHKAIEQRQRELAYENYMAKKKQLESAILLKEQKAAKAVKTPKNVSNIEASKTKPYYAQKQKKLQKNAKAIETRLEKLEKVEPVKIVSAIKMDLPNWENFHSRTILSVQNSKGIVGNRILWEETNFSAKGGEKLAITGANGSGKTTLLHKLIHQEDGIRFSPSVKIGYFSQTLNIIDKELSILENAKSNSKHDETLVRTVLARLGFIGEDVHKKVVVLSGGERVKVALAKIFLSDVNTLILDEPTNFLDVEAVQALESLLKEYEGTVIFVSHDRRFIKNLATRILSIKNGKIEIFDGTLEQFQQLKKQNSRPDQADEKLLLEMKISEVLSRLSMNPTEELEKEFQLLLLKKRGMN